MNKAGIRTIGAILLLAAAGFFIYGQTLPNNPPDLIAGGAIVIAALPVCVVLGLVLFFGSFLIKGRDR